MFPRGRWDGLCKSCWIDSSLFLWCPFPTYTQSRYYSLLVSDILWYIVLVSLRGLKRYPFPLTFPSQHSSEKPKNKYLLPFWWHRRILIPTYILLLWTCKEKLLLVQRQTAKHQCGILFPFPYFINFIAKLYSVYLNFFPLHFLDTAVNKEVGATTFFFFLHNYNWQVMKLFVKIFAFLSEKEKSEQGYLKNFIHIFCLVS